MRLVADLRDQHQRRRVAAQGHLVAPVGEHQLLEADLASFALLDAGDQAEVEAQFLEHLARHADLAPAAVDQHQVGQAQFGPGDQRGIARLGSRFVARGVGGLDAPGDLRGQLAVAPHQHLTHGGVVVAAGDALDVVTAVLRTLHLVILEHHAGCLSRLAGRVADVETLDAKRVELLDFQRQRVDQRPRARQLRTLLGQQLRQTQVSALDAHVQPRASRIARLVLGRDLDAALCRQRIDQCLVDRVAQHQQRRHATLEVMLRDERFEHQRFRRRRRRVLTRFVGCGFDTQRSRIVDMHREERPVAEMPATAHHRQVDAGPATLHLDRQDVGVAGGDTGVVLDRLLVQHPRQRAELVAYLGRLLELQRLGVFHHLRLQPVHDLLLLALQEALGVRHISRVVVGGDQLHARTRAALDLVQQARPAAVVEHRVLAGAQPEHLLQQLDRFLDRPGAGVRAEIAMPLIDRATVVGHPRVAR